MSTLLQEIWDREQCPIVNGIMFADGTVKLMELTRDTAPRTVAVRKETSLDSLQKSSAVLNGSYTEMAEAVDHSRSIRAVCGGASVGSNPQA